MDTPRFETSEEYNTLRAELLESRRYVFERPILIATVCAAALKFSGRSQLAFIPAGVIALLLFNFWFTVNRLYSMARIVAYIQLELEEASLGAWRGWETCLRFYRKWKKQHGGQVDTIVAQHLDQPAVPDSLMFYSPIFYLHIGVAAVAGASSLVYAMLERSGVHTAGAAGATALAIVFAFYAWRHRPGGIRSLIERNRVVWEFVFKHMVALGEK